ncbi:MAG TPA: ATP-binding cassette domain-containing protein, partial [Roseiarcus sp.]|nr:ATP-binding cassette domain-containing protein [Roseiarcus sp.]
MSNGQAVLEAQNVSKAFFGNQALRDVSIELIPGRIHALLGENGAGKSTLINLLSGTLAPDSGEIRIDGRAVSLTPGDAHRLGVAVVQQELSLAPHLSIAENIGLGAYPRRWGLVDYGRLAASVAEIGGQLGLSESADTPVSRLPTGRRQIVEIAKALAIKPRVLILDEPTSSLAAPDVAMLTRLVRRLRDQRVAILYISHRLNEIIDFCDYVTVLKDGAVTADRPLAGLDPGGLVRLMVG